MIGKRISWIAFTSLLTIVALSVVARILEMDTPSTLLLGSALGAFLIFSWAQRKIKEDMMAFMSEDFREQEWKYFFSSLIAFIIIIFATLLNVFIIFLEMPISSVIINVLLGAVILLMLYTVLAIPTVEKTPAYTVLYMVALVFTAIVIGSQLELGIHLPEDLAPTLLKMADPLFLLNIALLFEVASLMLGGEMPTPTSSVINIYERTRLREERPFLMKRNVIYLTIVVFIILFVLVNVIAVVGLPGRVELHDLHWEYAIILASVGLLVSLILYILLIMPEQTGKLREKYDPDTLQRIMVLSTSAAFTAAFVAIALLLQFGVLTGIGPLKLTSKNSLDFAVFAILSAIGPFGFYEYSRFRKMNLMEERFPEFLRDLSESRKAGMTMARAVETSAKGDYGLLTPEIKKMAVQISWGTSFTEALSRFGDRIQTPLVWRTTSLVVKASEAGGKISDVIDAAAKNVREIKILQAERKMEMQMYLLIIYVAFFVFLAVIIILSATFLPEFAKATESSSSVGGISFGKVSLEEFKFIYLSTALVQAIGNGAVAGMLGEGRAAAGLRHGTIMVLVTYILFKLVM
ncbi:MAG: type II secretion system F family protein [Candidatus Thermoplasmatota archaeon]|nr:type II secretion system F family protein [Candidatus Thermoplasmatota archaeon]